MKGELQDTRAWVSCFCYPTIWESQEGCGKVRLHLQRHAGLDLRKQQSAVLWVRGLHSGRPFCTLYIRRTRHWQEGLGSLGIPMWCWLRRGQILCGDIYNTVIEIPPHFWDSMQALEVTCSGPRWFVMSFMMLHKENQSLNLTLQLHRRARQWWH